MRITRIELEGAAGQVAIERRPGSPTLRIDSTLRDPKGEPAWRTWEVSARAKEDELFRIAETVQRRCDGDRGTHSMVHDYYRELQRFAD